MSELSAFDKLEKLIKKAESAKGHAEKSKLYGLLKAKLTKKKADGTGGITVNILGELSPADKKKISDAVAHLEHDIKEAEAGIERDKATLKKLKILL